MHRINYKCPNCGREDYIDGLTLLPTEIFCDYCEESILFVAIKGIKKKAIMNPCSNNECEIRDECDHSKRHKRNMYCYTKNEGRNNKESCPECTKEEIEDFLTKEEVKI